MAEPEFTSTDKQEVFRLLILLNSSLSFIVQQLGRLAAVKIISPNYLKEMTAITQEVKTVIKRVNPEN